MEDQGMFTGESDRGTSGAANQCEMTISNGNTWLADMVGDISRKIEEFCLDVEDCICKDTVNYVDGKVKKVGADVKSFCFKVVQEVFTSSLEQASEEIPTSFLEQASEEILSDIHPLESSYSNRTSDTANGDYLEEGSCSINNYSDVDFESCGDSTEEVLIFQAEATPLKSKDGHECASLMEGLGEYYLEGGSRSINNYSDVDFESYGDSTEEMLISQAEATPLKSEDGQERASLMEGVGEDSNGLDTCADSSSTVNELYCLCPEEHGSIIPDAASSNEIVEAIGLDCSAAEVHHSDESIDLGESCIIADVGELCSAPNEIIEQRPIQNEALVNMASTMRNYEFDESEWEII